MSDVYGGIEAGGTKWVCALYAGDQGGGPGGIRAEARFPTGTPEATLAQALAFFRQQVQAPDQLRAIGIGCFGPLDPDPASPTYGFITSTPKVGWANTDVAGVCQRELGVPVGFDTDVNAAALGENTWGAAQGLQDFIYLTIGTGIGGGGMVNGHLLHGLLHPEMGHNLIPHDRGADPFPGCCPYHRDCLEGLACGPAIQARWGQPGESLPPDHPAWELEANYLALALVNFVVTLSPRRIILGGGVMDQRQLYPMIRARMQALLNGYVRVRAVQEEIDRFVVPPGLGRQAGVMGAIALALRLAG
jgi:fructokinase